MSRPSSRLLATTTTTRTPSSLIRKIVQPATTTSRPFSQTCARTADSLLSRLDQASQQQQQQQQQQQTRTQQRPTTGPPRTTAASAGGTWDPQHGLASDILGRAQNRPTGGPAAGGGGWGGASILPGASYSLDFASLDGDAGASKQFADLGPPTEPFHFHVYAHKHNCHITVTKPSRGAILSLSAGNIGFRKGKRGTYDAAYQLTAYVMDKLNQGGWHKVIQSMEVVLRGFGTGREAATKVLLGTEGKMLRHTIVKVSDATRLKFGGTRSPKPRRLG